MRTELATEGPYKATVETYPSVAGNITIYSLATNDCIATIPKAWKNKKANAALLAKSWEMSQAIRKAHANIIQSTSPDGLDNASPEIKQAEATLRAVFEGIMVPS